MMTRHKRPTPLSFWLLALACLLGAFLLFLLGYCVVLLAILWGQ